MLRVAITGASSPIASGLIPLLAQGALKRPVSLRLIDPQPPQAFAAELEEFASPFLLDTQCSSDVELIRGADLVVLLGKSRPLLESSRLFVELGRAVGALAPEAKVLVVAGNTAALLVHMGGGFAPGQVHAMMRLDEHRAKSALLKRGAPPRVTIWGNHSPVQVVDPECGFIPEVQEVVRAKVGQASAVSLAWAAIEALREMLFPSLENQWYSSAMISDGNPWGIAPGIFFSMPLKTRADGAILAIDRDLSPALREAMRLSEEELLAERDLLLRV